MAGVQESGAAMKDIVLVYSKHGSHTCDLPETTVANIPTRHNTVVMCEECGDKYYAKPFVGEYSGLTHYNWKKVSRWNFWVKRLG